MKKINRSKVRDKNKVYNPNSSLHSEATKIKCETKASYRPENKIVARCRS